MKTKTTNPRLKLSFFNSSFSSSNKSNTLKLQQKRHSNLIRTLSLHHHHPHLKLLQLGQVLTFRILLRQKTSNKSKLKRKSVSLVSMILTGSKFTCSKCINNSTDRMDIKCSRITTRNNLTIISSSKSVVICHKGITSIQFNKTLDILMFPCPQILKWVVIRMFINSRNNSFTRLKVTSQVKSHPN
jgi:hypothetical protein